MGHLVLIRIQPYLDYGEHKVLSCPPGHSRYQSDAAPLPAK